MIKPSNYTEAKAMFYSIDSVCHLSIDTFRIVMKAPKGRRNARPIVSFKITSFGLKKFGINPYLYPFKKIELCKEI